MLDAAASPFPSIIRAPNRNRKTPFSYADDETLFILVHSKLVHYRSNGLDVPFWSRRHRRIEKTSDDCIRVILIAS
jgi:hypothetical protein